MEPKDFNLMLDLTLGEIVVLSIAYTISLLIVVILI